MFNISDSNILAIQCLVLMEIVEAIAMSVKLSRILVLANLFLSVTGFGIAGGDIVEASWTVGFAI